MAPFKLPNTGGRLPPRPKTDPGFFKQPNPNVGRFNRIYNRPNTIKTAIASGSLVGPAAIKELAQARQARRKFAGNIKQSMGGQQNFNQQSGNAPGELTAALRTARTAQTQTAAGSQPPDLLSTPLVQRAQQTRQTDLRSRRRTLLSAYLKSKSGPTKVPGRPQ